MSPKMKKEKLHNITNLGFKAPKGYFETFDDIVFEKINTKQHLNNINATGYNVPKDYFDTLETRVLNKIEEQKNTPVLQLPTKKHMYYITGVAASILLLIGIFITNNNTDQLSIEMVETYFENSDFNTYELAELLSDANLLEDDFTITETNYNEGNLEDYLLENSDIEFILD